MWIRALLITLLAVPAHAGAAKADDGYAARLRDLERRVEQLKLQIHGTPTLPRPREQPKLEIQEVHEVDKRTLVRARYWLDGLPARALDERVLSAGAHVLEVRVRIETGGRVLRLRETHRFQAELNDQLQAWVRVDERWGTTQRERFTLKVTKISLAHDNRFMLLRPVISPAEE